jgi:anti-anti-sigma factor
VTAFLEECAQCVIVELVGTLRAPVDTTLREKIGAVLRDDQKQIVVDLEQLSAIDAAGVGELMHVYETATEAGAVLRIAGANSRVRRLLEVAGVFNFLCGIVEHRAGGR